jgi:3-hydroxyisobutyrate dehydrogenase-like beta-hydroxyacid dehydrogenase
MPAQARNDPAFRGFLESFANLAEKDLSVTLEFARESGVELPGTARCRELMGRVYGLTKR